MTLRLVFGHALRNAPDALGATDRRAAVFLNNQCHGFFAHLKKSPELYLKTMQKTRRLIPLVHFNYWI
jgi:hypothetical protein